MLLNSLNNDFYIYRNRKMLHLSVTQSKYSNINILEYIKAKNVTL
ncbi:hypothetical protein CLROS_012380 [Clostridium felsineum]|uniref:Uncharacterized protein n=1 Tax=Clostridium felsineum TaxID=36839 RepID=A0A1S8LD66_9CLOT|nr:hypothetical protein CLROS_012380 [Clostridium felsineum]URZ10943.1 hypothetical protein CROST_016590 [Clostridium felsineum]